MSNNCTLLLVDLFFYSYDADFMYGFLMKNEKQAQSFNFMIHYIDDWLIGVWCPFNKEFLVQWQIGLLRSSYLKLHIEIDSKGLLRTRFTTRDDSNFPIVNFPYIIRFIPEFVVPIRMFLIAVSANETAIESRVHSGWRHHMKSFTPSWLCWPLQKVLCHGCVPFVVVADPSTITILSLVALILVRVARWVPLVEQDDLPFQSSCYSVLFYAKYFVYHLSFCPFSFSHCSMSFNIWLLIAPMVS